MRRKLEDRYNTELIGEIMHIAQGNEKFSIDFFDKKGGAWKRRLHYHDFYELEFVISGSAANVINGMRFELSRGMMFLIRPTDVHRYEIEPGEEISVCTVRFTSAMLDRNIVAALAGSSPLIADFSDSYDFLKALFDETWREYLERGSSRTSCSRVCERLAVMLCRKPEHNPSSVNRIAAAAAGLATSDIPDG
ncbi:MAG: AraC family ligand binding domain-containing protein [Eubacteriales bacterium]